MGMIDVRHLFAAVAIVLGVLLGLFRLRAEIAVLVIAVLATIGFFPYLIDGAYGWSFVSVGFYGVFIGAALGYAGAFTLSHLLEWIWNKLVR